MGPWVLGRHRQVPVCGSQPCPRAPPTSHRQPAVGGVRSALPGPHPASGSSPSCLRTLLGLTQRPWALRATGWGADPSPTSRGCPGLWVMGSESRLGAGALGLISDVCWGLRMEMDGGQKLCLLPHTQHRPGQASGNSQSNTGPYMPRPCLRVSASQGPRATWALTAAAEVVSLVQSKEAILTCLAGPPAHVRLAEALASALGAKGEGGSRPRTVLTTSPTVTAPQPRLTRWHSATPPSVPPGSQLQPEKG